MNKLLRWFGVGSKPAPVPTEPPLSFFAEINPVTKVVLRVIVAEQEFIDTGVVGDPANWIRTDPRLADYAGIGHVYDPVGRTFKKPEE